MQHLAMPRAPKPPPLARPDVFRVAVLAKVDPRTVESYVADDRMTRTDRRGRIERALRQVGREDLVHATGPGPRKARAAK